MRSRGGEIQPKAAGGLSLSLDLLLRRRHRRLWFRQLCRAIEVFEGWQWVVWSSEFSSQ
jgi:hypothetical protein